jgi:ribosome-associated translation inhibitor RaiA
MRVLFVDGALPSSSSLTAHAQHTVADALSAFAQRITTVRIAVADHNGRRAGPNDKSCAIVAAIAGKGTVSVRAVASDFYTAVSTASRRLARLLDRRIHAQRGQSPR